MKVYIAGKITGDSRYRDKFRRAENFLADQGYIVLNPAVMPEGMAAGDYMRICMAMIETADVVAFLDDYCVSTGALLEYDWCRYVDKQTMHLIDMRAWRDYNNAADME